MTSSSRRVVVTGLGCVTAAGQGVQALWEASRDGRSCVKPLLFDYPNQGVRTAAHLLEFEPQSQLSDYELPLDRFSALALMAAREALQQAGLFGRCKLGERAAVIVGCGIGGATTLDANLRRFYAGELRQDPMSVPKVMPSAAASHVSIWAGAKGPCFAISSACSSATQAIGVGASLIRAGAADLAIVGGTEALLTSGYFRAWELLRVMTPSLCRPFSISRNGMVLGEGAGILILEAASHSESRGVPVLAELAGYGTTSDASDLVRPDAAGAAGAMKAALADGSVDAEEIGYVNTHGTGTILNDITESSALQEVFGKRSALIPASSTKPIHGHTLGAAGAIEAIVTIKSLQEQTAPPTINWIGPDARCAIDPVPNEARPLGTRTAMSNSLAFGGINASLVFRAHAENELA